MEYPPHLWLRAFHRQIDFPVFMADAPYASHSSVDRVGSHLTGFEYRSTSQRNIAAK